MSDNINRNKFQKAGDTSRTSSEGRKTSSGGIIHKRGNREMNENTNTPKSEKMLKAEAVQKTSDQNPR